MISTRVQISKSTEIILGDVYIGLSENSEAITTKWSCRRVITGSYTINTFYLYDRYSQKLSPDRTRHVIGTPYQLSNECSTVYISKVVVYI